jgi:UDP-N-acetylglucosamine 2-epimerase (non-hydrolysing)
MKPSTTNILVVFGTRPEAIKLFPVIHALRREPRFNVTICVTAQHRDMLDQVLQVARLDPDIDLDLMRPNQTLPEMTARILTALDRVVARIEPDRIMVQGDTTTAMAASLSGYYRKIPVDHVEAGLRSGNIYAPWPEEVNRKIAGAIASLHFAPTKRAAEALRREHIPEDRIFVTGNTVIDALLDVRERLRSFPDVCTSIDGLLPDEGRARKIILVTAHRRENFDGGMDRVAAALKAIARREDTLIVFPLHPNPNVRAPMRAALRDHPRIRLIPPLDYLPFVYLLSRAHLVLTDSGGVQEEAPALGKPVLVMRDTTERPEGVEAGTALLVGTATQGIVAETTRLLDDGRHYERMSQAHNPFGDGKASRRITNILAAQAEAMNEEELRYAS